MKKNHFFGKYYKFISDEGFVFALIVSTANEGDMLQLVTPKKGYVIKNTKSVEIIDNFVKIDIQEEEVSLKGEIILGELHPLNKDVMGPFRHLPMECKHNIYSMYHSLNGEISFNDKKYHYHNAIGYIEGDEGVNFPTKYIWYNSVKNEATVTLAIATIPLLKVINFTGLLCFVKTKDEEYRFTTYNGAKIVSKSDKEIIIRKGEYLLKITISNIGGHNLKAPVKGDMVRYIKENIVVPTEYILFKKDTIILSVEDKLSSLEYMY